MQLCQNPHKEENRHARMQACAQVPTQPPPPLPGPTYCKRSGALEGICAYGGVCDTRWCQVDAHTMVPSGCTHDGAQESFFQKWGGGPALLLLHPPTHRHHKIEGVPQTCPPSHKHFFGGEGSTGHLQTVRTAIGCSQNNFSVEVARRPQHSQPHQLLQLSQPPRAPTLTEPANPAHHDASQQTDLFVNSQEPFLERIVQIRYFAYLRPSLTIISHPDMHAFERAQSMPNPGQGFEVGSGREPRPKRLC